MSTFNIVRLTKNEMDQLMVLKPGSSFYHVNLQHEGNNFKQFENRIFYGILIKENGEDANGNEILPVLDYTKMKKLELLDYETNIPVAYFIDKVDENFLMHNKTSLAESLVDKYLTIRNMSRDEILNGLCYVRHFRII